jgi:hypothetical protein
VKWKWMFLVCIPSLSWASCSDISHRPSASHHCCSFMAWATSWPCFCTRTSRSFPISFSHLGVRANSGRYESLFLFVFFIFLRYLIQHYSIYF